MRLHDRARGVLGVPVCVGCSFSFDVRAEATDTRGADDCVPDPRYSFLHADLLHDPVVADRIRISGWLELDQHYETAP